MLLGRPTVVRGQMPERPTSFRAVGSSRNFAVSGVVDDDLPPHVIEAQRQWEARHPDSGGIDGEGVDWHHHQLEVPSSLLEDLTRKHLKEVKDKVAGQLSSSKTGRHDSGRTRKDDDGLTFVDMGNVDHVAKIEKLSEQRPPDQFMAKRLGPGELLLWLHSAAGVDVDPMGSVLKWRDQVRPVVNLKPCAASVVVSSSSSSFSFVVVTYQPENTKIYQLTHSCDVCDVRRAHTRLTSSQPSTNTCTKRNCAGDAADGMAGVMLHSTPGGFWTLTVGRLPTSEANNFAVACCPVQRERAESDYVRWVARLQRYSSTPVSMRARQRRGAGSASTSDTVCGAAARHVGKRRSWWTSRRRPTLFRDVP